jgi:hypothetical protein
MLRFKEVAMHDHQPQRVRFTSTGKLDSSPEKVFPQLCPLREHDWIEGWQSTTLLPESGTAELDCIFTTEFEGHATWVVTRYEPSTRIEFAIFTESELVSRLIVTVEPTDDGGSRITWERVETSTGPGGDRILATRSQEGFERRTANLNQRLDHFLIHGTMMRDGHGPGYR